MAVVVRMGLFARFTGIFRTPSFWTSSAGWRGRRELAPGCSATRIRCISLAHIDRDMCHKRSLDHTHHNNNNTFWTGSVLTDEEPPPHSGELNHALSQVGGPTQSQLSRHVSSGHHISMEHRLKKKYLQLNSETDASNGTYLKKTRKRGHPQMGHS